MEQQTTPQPEESQNSGEQKANVPNDDENITSATKPDASTRAYWWRAPFLEHLAKCGNVTLAAKLTGIHRCTVYEHANTDPAFNVQVEEAKEEALDLLEAEARRRGAEGVEEVVVSAGKVMRDDNGAPLIVRKYSDTLLIALLKAHRPDKFSERLRQEVTMDVSVKSTQELESIATKLLRQANAFGDTDGAEEQTGSGEQV